MERNDMSSEPMDIDHSGNSIIDMDISYFSDPDETNTSVRTRLSSRICSNSLDQVHHITKSSIQPNQNYYRIIKQRSWKRTLFKIIIAVVITSISIITYNIHSLKCCDQLNLKLLNVTLSNKLYGQSAAANLIIETLEFKMNSKILIFSGGTGVGKTLTSSLILDHIRICSNTYHYTMHNFENTFSPDFMFGLTICESSVVVVDDLSTNNIYIKEQIRSLIEKSETLGKQITVILIYNCNENLYNENSVIKCGKLYNNKLLGIFSGIQALIKVIPFEPLSMTHLKQCIKQEMGNRKLNDLQFEAVLKNFNVSVDGCKGVHSKIKYLNI